MNINWQVRFNNPVWWGQVVLAIATPIFTYYGVNFKEITTWGALIDLFIKAIQNPFVVTSIVISLLNTINDPTTKNFGDSARALKYIYPN